eukprot:TRINITY_DN12752_c0_g1_i1.p1 TRINITY_DN12752_c0_g1~~TRINITY_DN12752_c0_g1_i1.p1  ORF type:complete len:464 (-),score=68.56 TRINITY_DN12752_c0_g1_i1:136-1527(-)
MQFNSYSNQPAALPKSIQLPSFDKKTWENIEILLVHPLRETSSAAQFMSKLISYHSKDQQKVQSLKEFGRFLEGYPENGLTILKELIKSIATLGMLRETTTFITILQPLTQVKTTIPRTILDPLIASAILGMLPENRQSLNFQSLYMLLGNPSQAAKLKMILSLFENTDLVSKANRRSDLTVQRRVLDPYLSHTDWIAMDVSLGELQLMGDSSSMEEGASTHAIVDFANRWVGGGVLHHGCLQEEILFASHPLLLASMAFVAPMTDKEAIIFEGPRKMCTFRGYGRTLEFEGAVQEGTFPAVQLIAIDALPFGRVSELPYDAQFRPEFVLRELNKAFVGFDKPKECLEEHERIATGNWGCGAFGGNLQLKSLIQWLAASKANRPLSYYTFGQIDMDGKLFSENLKTLKDLLSNRKGNPVTVGTLSKLLFNLPKSFDGNFISYLRDQLQPPPIAKPVCPPFIRT